MNSIENIARDRVVSAEIKKPDCLIKTSASIWVFVGYISNKFKNRSLERVRVSYASKCNVRPALFLRPYNHLPEF